MGQTLRDISVRETLNKLMTRKKTRHGDYKKRQKIRIIIITVICIIAIIALPRIISALRTLQTPEPSVPGTGPYSAADFSIPRYSGSAYVEINDNIPFFRESDITTAAYEEYSPLDRHGRCGPAMACLGRELMPTEERGEIGMIRPSGGTR